MSRLLITLALLVCLIDSFPPVLAKAPDAQPQGHPIGSAGFHELLDKQAKPGVFTTEPQADGSYLLSNKMQTVSARITSSGVQFDSIGNSAGKGGFGLQLQQWGRKGAWQQASSSSIYADGDTVYHTHVGGIAEKFSNTNDGIRQDFIIPLRPEGRGDLQVLLQVSGAQAEQNADAASIVLNSGRRLTYNNLKVTDSNNRIIPARMQVANNTITLAVDDSAAQYPLTIDPTVGDENWVGMGGFTGADNVVYSAVYAGSALYIGGNFEVVGNVVAHHIAKWDGSKWSALGSGWDDRIQALAVDQDGNVYAGGESGVAKWDGIRWSALGGSMNGPVLALVAYGSGNLYAGGGFTKAGVVTVNRIANWNGNSWIAMAGGMNEKVRALVLDGGGNLYVGGQFTMAGGVQVNRVARWYFGTWQPLGVGMDNDYPFLDLTGVNDLVLDNAGNLYAGGTIGKAGGVDVNNIAKWNGSSWSAVGGGFEEAVTALAVDNSNGLYAAVSFIKAAGVIAYKIAKWNGSGWSVLGSGTNGRVLDLAVGSGGSLYSGGSFETVDGITVNHIARWDGSGWYSFVNGTYGKSVSALVVDDKGAVYAGGDFSANGGMSANSIAKWDGSKWIPLGGGFDNAVKALALDGSGTLYAGGWFTEVGGVVANHVAKWNGGGWSALGGGLSGNVSALVVDPGGALYVGGQFASAGGVPANGIAKWDGGTWHGLGSGLNGVASALAVDGQGNTYVGGTFTMAGDLSANNVARWDGENWYALGSGKNSGVNALVIDRNANLYAGGSFGVAKWDGASWSAVGSGLNGTVNALAVDSIGTLYAGGDITKSCAKCRIGIAKWSGSRWLELGSGVNNIVEALALDGIGQLYAGGAFTIAGDKVSVFVAQWVGDLDADDDGVLNVYDAMPFNPAEWLDADSDGIGNNADPDDDNDNVTDLVDNCIYLSNSDQADDDGDGLGDACTWLARQGEIARENFGSSIAFGDINGDSFTDMLVGSPLATVEISGKKLKRAGKIIIISGKDKSVLGVLEGGKAGQRFGVAIAVTRDQDGDGVLDVLVGEPNETVVKSGNNKLKRAGYVRMYSGATGNLLKTVAEGARSGERFGTSLAVGDVNVDGDPDLVVGAPYADSYVRQAGQITVFNGISDSVLYQRTGNQLRGGFGAAVAVANGLLFVGEPRRNSWAGKRSGRVSVFNAATGGGDALFVVNGNSPKEEFGAAVAANDVLWAAGGQYSDRVLVYTRWFSSPLQVLQGVKRDAFGTALGMADLNGDGKPDLAVGSSHYDALSPNLRDAGMVFVLDGAGW